MLSEGCFTFGLLVEVVRHGADIVAHVELHRVFAPATDQLWHQSLALEPLQLLHRLDGPPLGLKVAAALEHIVTVGAPHERLRESQRQMRLLVVPLHDLLVEEVEHAFEELRAVVAEIVGDIDGAFWLQRFEVILEAVYF